MRANGTRMLADAEIAAVVRAEHGDPFAVLGPHVEAKTGGLSIRTFQPQASRVQALAPDGTLLAELDCVHQDGFFAGTVPRASATRDYRLRVTVGESSAVIDDPYRFGPVLGEVDVYLIGEGRHLRLYEKFGAHEIVLDGVAGIAFALWAPNARRVSVVGTFNDWDGRRHPMRLLQGAGVWEIFVPGLERGALYKYEIIGPHGLLPLKSDPYAFAAERPPASASIVARAGSDVWSDDSWMARRAVANRRDAPIAIYEVHLGSWKRAEGNRYLTYRELAHDLVPYAASLGFTHLELMPVSEHPFDGSWGYQVIGLFAPTSRFGTPQDFAYFVQCAHEAGLGVLLDWVPGHFPTDAHGLANFDGTHLYEHADPRQGFQPDWNTLIFNFGRHEVANYLIANALFWPDRYHVDGLRVDAVASMLYLDYSRKANEWIPNAAGGRENLGAVEFLQRTNEAVYGDAPGAITIAEESTSWPKVSQPVYLGGLGFGYKWNMGWMHDTLAFMRQDPLYRNYELDGLTFSFMYAFSENFVLPLSHDEVVHGKGSLLRKMPGDSWQRFANLRAFYGYMYAHPGKKLLFMGAEFAQEREWNHDRSLDWHVLEDGRHAGIMDLVRDLNRTYTGLPALHELDAEPAGIEWIVSDRFATVVAFVRRARDPEDVVVSVTNFTPVVRNGYRLGVPFAGTYVEAINTDAERYGGSGIHNGPLVAAALGAHEKPFSVEMTLPPLASVMLKRAFG
jgi:1,4-alpha-glucan branching enzyme